MNTQPNDNVNNGSQSPQAAGGTENTTAAAINITNAGHSQASGSPASPQNLANATVAQTTGVTTQSTAGSATNAPGLVHNLLQVLGLGGPQGSVTNGNADASASVIPADPVLTSNEDTCPCCGSSRHDMTAVWTIRSYSDQAIFDFAVKMGATHPHSQATASILVSQQQTSAQRHQDKAQLLTPAETKAVIAQMGKATLDGEDSLTREDLAFGHFPNVYYRLPLKGNDGKPVIAAINMEFLPHRYRENAIGRPATFSSRLKKFSAAFWNDYYPTPEGAAAIAELNSTGEPTFWSSAAEYDEALPFGQIKLVEVKFVPASFSGFDFDVLYDPETAFCWPLIHVSELDREGTVLPWQNPRSVQYFGFAPAPVDVFNVGPPRNPQVSMSPASHPRRIEELIRIKGEKVDAFINSLEKVDAGLLSRMARVGLGLITLSDKRKVVGCSDCHGELDATKDTNIVVIPCGSQHVVHASCLKNHIMQLDVINYWSCSVDEKIIQANVGTDATGTQWLVPRPSVVRSLRDELVRRERARI